MEFQPGDIIEWHEWHYRILDIPCPGHPRGSNLSGISCSWCLDTGWVIAPTEQIDTIMGPEWQDTPVCSECYRPMTASNDFHDEGLCLRCYWKRNDRRGPQR